MPLWALASTTRLQQASARLDSSQHPDSPLFPLSGAPLSLHAPPSASRGICAFPLNGSSLLTSSRGDINFAGKRCQTHSPSSASPHLGCCTLRLPSDPLSTDCRRGFLLLPRRCCDGRLFWSLRLESCHDLSLFHILTFVRDSAIMKFLLGDLQHPNLTGILISDSARLPR